MCMLGERGVGVGVGVGGWGLGVVGVGVQPALRWLEQSRGRRKKIVKSLSARQASRVGGFFHTCLGSRDMKKGQPVLDGEKHW